MLFISLLRVIENFESIWYIVFSCLDISVKHSLSLFIYYVKMGKIHHFCNKICCQTSMFINSPIATIEKYCDIPVYSGKMSWYSAIFRDIPPYSVIFRHIPWYSAIFRDIPAFRIFTTPLTQNLSRPWDAHMLFLDTACNMIDKCCRFRYTKNLYSHEHVRRVTLGARGSSTLVKGDNIG